MRKDHLCQLHSLVSGPSEGLGLPPLACLRYERYERRERYPVYRHGIVLNTTRACAIMATVVAAVSGAEAAEYTIALRLDLMYEVEELCDHPG